MTAAMEFPRRLPWHYWVVTVLALLWNAFGAYDFVMSLTAGETYMRQMGMTQAQIDYYNAMPVWMLAAWVLGVWGGVAGAVLLALRSRWATHAFIASLVGMVLNLIYTHLLTNGGDVMAGQATVMSAVITAVCIFLVWYAWRMTKRGLLR